MCAFAHSAWAKGALRPRIRTACQKIIVRARVGRGPKAQSGRAATSVSHCVAAGEDAWSIANTHGVSLAQLTDANRRNQGVALSALREGQTVWLPPACSTVQHGAPPPPSATHTGSSLRLPSVQRF